MNKLIIKLLFQSGKLFGLAVGMAVLTTGCQTYTQQGKDITQSWRQGNVAEAAKQFTAKAENNKDNKTNKIKLSIHISNNSNYTIREK